MNSMLCKSMVAEGKQTDKLKANKYKPQQIGNLVECITDHSRRWKIPRYKHTLHHLLVNLYTGTI